MTTEKQWPEQRSRMGTCQKCGQARRIAKVHVEGEKATIRWCLPCFEEHAEAKS